MLFQRRECTPFRPVMNESTMRARLFNTPRRLSSEVHVLTTDDFIRYLKKNRARNSVVIFNTREHWMTAVVTFTTSYFMNSLGMFSHLASRDLLPTLLGAHRVGLKLKVYRSSGDDAADAALIGRVTCYYYSILCRDTCTICIRLYICIRLCIYITMICFLNSSQPSQQNL